MMSLQMWCLQVNEGQADQDPGEEIIKLGLEMMSDIIVMVSLWPLFPGISLPENER